MTATAATADLLNDYAGDNIWEDLIYGLDGYDEALTDAVADAEGRDVVIDGVHYHRHDTQGWIVWDAAVSL